MRRSSRRDDFSFMQGNGNGENKGTGNGVVDQVQTKQPQLSLYTPPCALDKGAVLRELTKIRTMVERYDLNEQPEVLAGLLDEFKAAVQSGNQSEIISFFKKPVVYGGIAAVLAVIILIKVSRKKRR